MSRLLDWMLRLQYLWSNCWKSMLISSRHLYKCCSIYIPRDELAWIRGCVWKVNNSFFLVVSVVLVGSSSYPFISRDILSTNCLIHWRWCPGVILYITDQLPMLWTTSLGLVSDVYTIPWRKLRNTILLYFYPQTLPISHVATTSAHTKFDHNCFW